MSVYTMKSDMILEKDGSRILNISEFSFEGTYYKPSEPLKFLITEESEGWLFHIHPQKSLQFKQESCKLKKDEKMTRKQYSGESLCPIRGLPVKGKSFSHYGQGGVVNISVPLCFFIRSVKVCP